MSNSDKRHCRLSASGLQKWKSLNIEADPRQVFTIEYQAEEHFWIKAWWGESMIIEPDLIREVIWDEVIGDYI